MKEYDVIAIGTGSAMNIISSLMNNNPKLKIAVIDKDAPGGICLTKGCIPTKILVYPAEIIRLMQKANLFGIDAEIKKIDFKFVMERMRSIIGHDMENINNGLSNAKEIDYYREIAEFIGPYTLKVGKEKIKGKTFLLCTGSKPKIPRIEGLDKISYHTSDSILEISELPESICIVGGGYIAAEYGHFFSAMGSKVTILGRNPQFLPQEEPEISALA
ncbi:MAG: FAD-dependent oxidoreductase, partial [Candidatus Heimdallarchaeota archaeon]